MYSVCGSACETGEVEIRHSSLFGCSGGSAESTHVFLRVSALPWLLPFITVGTARRGSCRDVATCPRRGFDSLVEQGAGLDPYKRGSCLLLVEKRVRRSPRKRHCPCSFKKVVRSQRPFNPLKGSLHTCVESD